MDELERLINSCMLAGVSGPALPEWLAEGLRAGLAGITIFPGPHLADRGAVAAVAAQARAVDPEALVSLDEEGGDVTRLEYAVGSSYPGNLALGEADDLDLTRRTAAAMAQDLVAAGVNYNLAPSLDVNSDPRNPIIGVRSFGAEAHKVTRHGVAVAAKHFPGHGDTVTDPHLTMPKVEADATTLHRRELAPFAAAAEAGVASLMVAHALYSALDENYPATCSPHILQTLLRAELGYPGVVLSTAVAIEAGHGTERACEAAVATLAAGSDLLLLGPAVTGHIYAAICDAIATALRSGQVSQAALEASQARIARMRQQFRIPADTTGKPGQPGSTGTRQRAAIGLTAARRAVRARGTVALRGPATVVELRPAGNAATGEAYWSLAGSLSSHGLVARTIQITSEADISALPDFPDLPQGPLVLAVRDAYRTPWQREFALKTCAARPDAILVAVGMPDDAGLSQGPFIAAYGAGFVNLQAASDLLAGAVSTVSHGAADEDARNPDA
jgi:beta-N-acetylhexosaminidase